MADKKISALTAASTPLAGTEVLPIVQSSSTVKVSAADVTAGRVVGMKAVSLDSAGSSLPAGGGMVRLSNGYTYVAGSSTGNGIIISNGDGTATIRAILPGGSTGAIEVETGAGALAGTFTAAGNYAPANGKGIDFSATSGTGTSELLADYEEGTWTPALLFDNSMVGSFTYTTQVGTYTKVGRLVTASFNLAWTARPSGGSIMVLNIPFTAVNAANVRGFISDQGGITNIGTYAILAGDGLVISSYVSTQCSIATVQSGAGFADPLQQTALTSASGQLRGEIIFEVS